MESTGGEPDVIGHDPKSGHFTFCDCAPESPTGRRSTCYDGEARAARKENKPDHSAIEMAAATGIDLLTEAQYRALQKLVLRRQRLPGLAPSLIWSRLRVSDESSVTNCGYDRCSNREAVITVDVQGDVKDVE